MYFKQFNYKKIKNKKETIIYLTYLIFIYESSINSLKKSNQSTIDLQFKLINLKKKLKEL